MCRLRRSAGLHIASQIATLSITTRGEHVSPARAPVRKRRGFFCVCLLMNADSATSHRAPAPRLGRARRRPAPGRGARTAQGSRREARGGAPAVAKARERLTENQTARRAIEKDVAMHQGRLSKFRDQAMAVKTNQEYHAIQHEIAFAQNEIKALEDKDTRADGRGRRADRRLETRRGGPRRRPEDGGGGQECAGGGAGASSRPRSSVFASSAPGSSRALDPNVLRIFEVVSRRRNGVAVAEARDGICTICHVRLGRRCSTPCAGTKRSSSATAATASCYFVPAAGATTPTQPIP